MAIIKKYNKSNGTTYVYDSVSYWDKEKQQPRSKRKLIGKLDPTTGEIIPTGTRGRKASVKEPDHDLPPGNDEESFITEEPTEYEDYQQLYEETRRLLLEKEARVASLESTVAQLTKDKQDLVEKLEQMVREYRR